jgi:hypothetical protein
MLMPARVDATLTDEHTRCVPLIASGAVGVRRPLLHEAAEAADEVDADLFGGGVERVRHLDVGGGVVAAHDVGDGRQRDALVDDRDAVLVLDLVGHADQPAGPLHDLGVHPLGDLVRIARRAIEQRDAHRDGAHVEVLGPDHADGLEDLLLGDEDHGATPGGAGDARCGA